MWKWYKIWFSVPIKSSWNPAILICSHIAYSWFCTTVTDLSNISRDCAVLPLCRVTSVNVLRALGRGMGTCHSIYTCCGGLGSSLLRISQRVQDMRNGSGLWTEKYECLFIGAAIHPQPPPPLCLSSDCRCQERPGWLIIYFAPRNANLAQAANMML